MRGALFVCAAAGWLIAGCLPGDTRPPPGMVALDVEPSAAVLEGTTTEDGWQVSFERLLAGLGDADLEGEKCTGYADARYDRVFDFTVPGRQKLSDVYGLGRCEVELRLRSPREDALLGEGVTAADRAFLREPAEDLFEDLGRANVYVRGQAEREGVTKRFAWTFRGRHELRKCGDATSFKLEGDEEVPLHVVVHGEELFRSGAAKDAPLGFDLLADADTDGDGAITLEELLSVDAPEDAPEVDLPMELPGVGTFAAFLQLTLVPRMIRPGDAGRCKVDSGPGGFGFGPPMF